ncbi:hypothetical protein F0562_029713 [Nyssa sinensis]|uniref:Xylanase inhibitor N-terminal domain-containing protein n=1 Tax=Nyssa sinensis TaxID=561372 RepID=A0A5J5B7V0_9ASTE|nr:hypothetical protein F0562_029713 [Nyssa sinensis]
MKSSTYIELPCDSKPCQVLQSSQWDNTKNQYQYSIGYGDGSYTNGVLTTDTFTFDSAGGQAAAFPNSVFGCGYDNGGTFNSRESGLVGLGGGPLSLVSQLATEIDQKFAYCLLPRTVNSASKLRFGTDAVLSSQGIVSTPLISRGSRRVMEVHDGGAGATDLMGVRRCGGDSGYDGGAAVIGDGMMMMEALVVWSVVGGDTVERGGGDGGDDWRCGWGCGGDGSDGEIWWGMMMVLDGGTVDGWWLWRWSVALGGSAGVTHWCVMGSAVVRETEG